MTTPAVEEAFRNLRLAVSGYLVIMDEGDALQETWRHQLDVPTPIRDAWVRKADAALMLVRAAIERLPP